MLDCLPLLSKEDPSFISFLQTFPFLTNRASQGESPSVSLLSPLQLYDPDQLDILPLFDEQEEWKEIFPHNSYCEEGTLLTLRKLGIRRKLDSKGIIDRIERISNKYRDIKLQTENKNIDITNIRDPNSENNTSNLQERREKLIRLAKNLLSYIDQQWIRIEEETAKQDFPSLVGKLRGKLSISDIYKL